MTLLPAGVKVHLAFGYTDMRKGIDGLAMLVQGVLRQDPFSGHLFVFRGRRANPTSFGIPIAVRRGGVFTHVQWSSDEPAGRAATLELDPAKGRDLTHVSGMEGYSVHSSHRLFLDETPSSFLDAQKRTSGVSNGSTAVGRARSSAGLSARAF